MTDHVTKDLLYTEMNYGKYLTKHYALWLDLRTKPHCKIGTFHDLRDFHALFPKKIFNINNQENTKFKYFSSQPC